MSLVRIALLGPLIVAALLVGGYIYAHDPFACDGGELVAVPLSEDDPAQNRVGSLTYMGGLDIPRMEQNIGGLSGLRWDAESGRLLAITDDARWVWLTPEEKDGQLVGLTIVEAGDLLGLDGEPLKGKDEGDSESLTRSDEGGWLVGFERDHRIWYYPALGSAAKRTGIDPSQTLGALEDNNGVETFAASENTMFMCAERQASRNKPNCARYSGREVARGFAANPPAELTALGSVPTDADSASDGTLYILFRSYSPAKGNTAAIVAYAPDGTRRELAVLRPPLTVDNFEGLAVREEEGKTFLYIVSDDNFSGSQRTLLMKFALSDAD